MTNPPQENTPADKPCSICGKPMTGIRISCLCNKHGFGFHIECDPYKNKIIADMLKDGGFKTGYTPTDKENKEWWYENRFWFADPMQKQFKHYCPPLADLKAIIAESARRERVKCLELIEARERKLDKRYGCDSMILNELRDLHQDILSLSL